jgi:uncharacterized protein YndB with AHSA1/START domain
MIEIVRERHVDLPTDRVWPLVEDPEKLSEWFTAADRIEVLEGSGLGRKQRLHGRWGRKRAEIDQVVTEYLPGKVLAWRHQGERLDGKPAPEFARETVFSIRLQPEGAGTRVRLESRQEPAGPVRGLLIRLFGKRKVAGHMEGSLASLAARVGERRA